MFSASKGGLHASMGFLTRRKCVKYVKYIKQVQTVFKALAVSARGGVESVRKVLDVLKGC